MVCERQSDGKMLYQNCCIAENIHKTKCHVDRSMLGKDKILELLQDAETQKIVWDMKGGVIQ